jgi:hypothetical protein
MERLQVLSHDSRDKLAEGEDPSTSSRQEAERWIAIYTQLSQLEGDLIKTARERLPRMSPEARRETERTNLPMLEQDSERFNSRLAFWRERLAKLSAQR